MSTTVNIAKLAKVLRSKNAGPFILTLDMFFDDDQKYQVVKKSGVINKGHIAKLYDVPVTDIIGPFFVDAAKGIKVSIVRSDMAASDPDGTDMFSKQQHIPLLAIEIPVESVG